MGVEMFQVTYLQNKFASEPERHEEKVSKVVLIGLLKRADVSVREARLIYKLREGEGN